MNSNRNPNADYEARLLEVLESCVDLCNGDLAFLTLRDGSGSFLASSVGVTLSQLPSDLSFVGRRTGLFVVEDVRDTTRLNSFIHDKLGGVFYAELGLATSSADDIGTISIVKRCSQSLDATQISGLESLARAFSWYIEETAQSNAAFSTLAEHRDRLEQDEALFQLLGRIGEVTRATIDAEEVMRKSSKLLGSYLGASRCAYAEVNEDSNRFTILEDFTDGCESASGHYSLKDFGELVEQALKKGETVALRDVEGELSESDGASSFLAIDIRAIIVCPLIKGGALVAMMAVHQTEPRDWTDREIRVVEEVVERCWDSIERARAESRARENEDQLRDFFEHAPDAIIITDSQGLIAAVNLQAEALFGYPRSELSGLSVDILIPSTDQLNHESLRQEYGQRPHGRTVTSPTRRLRAVRKDGSSFPADISLSPLHTKTGLNVATAIRDATESEQYQNHILRTQRLESLGTLAGGVAHDLNNALAPILMATELLLAEFPESEELIELIDDNVKRGAGMVRQLLTFAKGVDGERFAVDLHDLLNKMLRTITATFPKNIHIQTHIDAELHPVIGDSTQLHQVLMNLCVNARDAMADGGTLSLSFENIEIDDAYASSLPNAEAGSYVLWKVADTGEGMDREKVGRIFEPFYSTKEADKGTGLGLSTVLGIVRSHGGFIEVYSRPNRGTLVSVYFPARTSSEEVGIVESSSTDVLTGNGETVLIVDDEKSVRDVFQRVLQNMNYNVLTAADSTQALILVAEHRDSIRAVFSDLHMPQINGIVLARALAQMIPQTPIAIMTGRLDEREKLDLSETDISLFLNKPFSGKRLLGALREMLDQGPRARSPHTQRSSGFN